MNEGRGCKRCAEVEPTREQECRRYLTRMVARSSTEQGGRVDSRVKRDEGAGDEPWGAGSRKHRPLHAPTRSPGMLQPAA